MFKKLFCIFSSLFAFEQQTEAVTSFLDKEQRPGAELVTESFIDFGNSDEILEVKGVLGAIKSDRRPGTYVAFSGVEIKTEELNVEPSGEHLSFDLSAVKSVEVLTVQLVLKNRELYALDLVQDNQKKFKLPLVNFRESFRGRLGDQVYRGAADQISSLRFFLKRSENSPSSFSPLSFEFSLSKVTLSK